jgi:NOL1/NOP2/fmu family ribosome biogenesis protein
MYLEPLIKKYVSSPSIVLDLCAAPGGKSTHLSAILPEDSLLVSNEVIRSRANILMENLIKWGRPDTIIINNDPSEIAVSQRFFDVIVADVPCSGEGMFRKDPKSNQEWSPENVKLCAERQKRIIADIWPALKPGGILIYSTCTYNKRENEENLDWISRRLGAELLEEPRRLMPHQVKGEGFFIAALRKTAEEGKSSASAVSKKTNRLKNESKLPIPQEVKKYLLNAEKFSVINDDHTIKAVPTKYRTHYELLKRLNILNVGISLAKVKGKDIIPLHSLAMSVELNPSAFPVLEMSKEDALRYLRKESTFEIPTNLPKGYVLVCYQGNPLGFIKNIGNRINNLYPNEWRIRMQIPGENVSGG